MRRRFGAEIIRTTDSHGHGNHKIGCEICVDSAVCLKGNPSACPTGVIRPLGNFGTNFTTTPMSRNAPWGGRRKKTHD